MLSSVDNAIPTNIVPIIEIYIYKAMILSKNNLMLYKKLKLNFNTYMKILKNTIKEVQKNILFQPY